MIISRRPSLLKRLEAIGGISKVEQNGFVLLSVLEDRSLSMNHTLTLDIPNKEMLYLTGIKNKTTLDRARNKCSQLGIIQYVAPPRGGKGGKYHLNQEFFPVPDEDKLKVVEKLDQLINQLGSHFMVHFLDQLGNQSSDIYKYIFNNYKQVNTQMDNEHPMYSFWTDVTDTWKEVFKFDLKRNHSEILRSFIDQEGMNEILIIEAIDRVKQADKPVLRYLWKILKNWTEAGIKTIPDLLEYEKNKMQQQPKSNIQRSKKKQDNLTDLARIKQKRGLVNG